MNSQPTTDLVRAIAALDRALHRDIYNDLAHDDGLTETDLAELEKNGFIRKEEESE